VQVLFAFLLAVPFANGWDRVTDFQRDVFFVAFLCTAVATVVLITDLLFSLAWRWSRRWQPRSPSPGSGTAWR
jgi:hypothetical protein